MGKRLHIISISEQQKPTEMEPSNELTLSDQSYSQEESQSIPKASTSKKVRGHTKKQAIWDLESNELVVVNFDETSQPVGDEAKDFTRFLGTLVRMPQHVPIDIGDWRKIPDDKKEDLWNIVKGKFSFAPAETEEIKNWVMYDMGVKWKSWKYELKRNSYDLSLSIDEIVDGQTESRVNKTQFKKLVTSWFDEKTQVIDVRLYFKIYLCRIFVLSVL